MKAGMDEWLIETAVAMYDAAETAVRTGDGPTYLFKLLVDPLQGSALGVLQFSQ